MKDVILTTDLYHGHADPNDHWNLASMFALAHKEKHTEKSVCFSL